VRGPASSDVRGPHWTRNLLVAIGVLLLSGVAARSSSSLIDVWYPDRPKPPDFLFDLLPYIAWPQYLTDLALIAALVLLITYALRGHTREIPKMIMLFAIMELLRATINLLTPLAGPLASNQSLYGIFPFHQYGEFPSGHAASVYLAFLLVDREQAPGIRIALGVCLVVEIVALLVSHGHYSIDIVGGLLLSYFVFHWFGPRVFPASDTA